MLTLAIIYGEGVSSFGFFEVHILNCKLGSFLLIKNNKPNQEPQCYSKI